jgi:hypothetical protein
LDVGAGRAVAHDGYGKNNYREEEKKEEYSEDVRAHDGFAGQFQYGGECRHFNLPVSVSTSGFLFNLPRIRHLATTYLKKAERSE